MSEPRATAETDELVITERVTKVVWSLADGDAMRTADAATMTGLTWSGALRLLKRISRMAPIYQDEDGFWQRCEFREIDW